VLFRSVSSASSTRLHKHLFEMRGVVSRKKQLFPHLGRLLGKLAAP
jgi:manganese-dependent inorganic pyrophosphatase